MFKTEHAQINAYATHPRGKRSDRSNLLYTPLYAEKEGSNGWVWPPPYDGNGAE